MAMKKENPDSRQDETYAKRNKKKKAKFQVDEKDDKENLKLVDDFVQDVIEKAKCEYLRQCTNHHGDSDVTDRRVLLGDNRRDQGGENGDIVKDRTAENDRTKNKRKHNYKYSDPVDEKEISAYEQQEGDKLLELNPNFGNRRESRRPLYDRIVTRFRSVLGCCIGKT